ncbi:MAG: NAD(P)H-dependent oxidoreductase [Acidimicrobiia bacterium]|nr:NAD(P)H-dependent oxidoreductase [Acidimicrobiia bacterium]
MESPVRIVALAGSYRSNSLNQALLAAAAEEAPAHVEVAPFDLRDVPLYDGDLEVAGDPEPVRALKDAVRGADAVLIATPEYNSSIPAVLKNGIDWASRGRPDAATSGKPVAMFGASGGRSGTRRAQEHLALVLSRIGMEPVAGAHLQVASAGAYIEDGIVTSDVLRAEVRNAVETLISAAEARRADLAEAV